MSGDLVVFPGVRRIAPNVVPMTARADFDHMPDACATPAKATISLKFRHGDHVIVDRAETGEVVAIRVEPDLSLTYFVRFFRSAAAVRGFPNGVGLQETR